MGCYRKGSKYSHSAAPPHHCSAALLSCMRECCVQVGVVNLVDGMDPTYLLIANNAEQLLQEICKMVSTPH